MASMYVRLLDPQALSASKESPREQVIDFGAYKQLNVDVRVIKAGTGTAAGTIKLQHAAVNEPDAFRNLTNASWVIDSTGTGGYLEITAFLRFVRWVTDSNVAGSPVVLIDVMAKE